MLAGSLGSAASKAGAVKGDSAAMASSRGREETRSRTRAGRKRGSHTATFLPAAWLGCRMSTFPRQGAWVHPSALIHH